MENTYEPSRKDIVKGMMHDYAKPFRKSNLKKFSKSFIEMGGVVAIVPYVIPSVVDSFREEEGYTHRSPTKSETLGDICGAITGLGSWVLQGWGYLELIDKGHPEASLLLPISNIASGIYEHQRKVKQRLKNGYSENRVSLEEASLEQTIRQDD